MYWAQFGGDPIATAGCSSCGGSLFMDMSLVPLAPVRAGLGLLLGLCWEAPVLKEPSHWSSGLLTEGLFSTLPPWLPLVGAPFLGAPEWAPNEMNIQWSRNWLERLWHSSLSKKNGFDTAKGEELKGLPKWFFFLITLNLYEVYESAVIYPYTGVWDSVGVPEISCLHFAKLRRTASVAGSVRLSTGKAWIKLCPGPIQPCSLTAHLETGVLGPKADADHTENQGEEEIWFAQWNPLLSFWETECFWDRVSQMRSKSSCKVVGGIVSILSHSTFILTPNDDSWGWGGCFCSETPSEGAWPSQQYLRIPGEVCLTVLETASVNTLGSMSSTVATFSPGKFSSHT